MHGTNFFKIFIFLVFSVLPTWAQIEQDKDILKLQEYGENSTKLPKFLGSNVNPMFFEKSLQNSFENRTNYTQRVDIEKNQKDYPSSDNKFFITLANIQEAQSALCISIEYVKNNNFQNYLVGLSSFETKTLIFESTDEIKEILFVSIQDFQTEISWESNFRIYSLGGQADEPVIDHGPEDGTFYCRSISVRRRVEHISGEYVDALFVRSERAFDTYTCTFPQSPSLGFTAATYELKVFWPSDDVLHHYSKGTWPTCTLCYLNICPPKCLMQGYVTQSVVPNDGPILYWRHIDYKEPGNLDPSFDDVLFRKDCGKAFCSDRNIVGKCANDPNEDWFWFVYDKNYRYMCD